MSASQNFECHVTEVPSDDPSWIETIEGIAKEHKFKTSFITGDPVLGKANKKVLDDYIASVTYDK